MEKEKIIEEFGYLIAEAKAVIEEEPLTEETIKVAYEECDSQMGYLHELIYGCRKEDLEENFKRFMQRNK